jgi:hypothetical protein
MYDTAVRFDASPASAEDEAKPGIRQLHELVAAHDDGGSAI